MSRWIITTARLCVALLLLLALWNPSWYQTSEPVHAMVLLDESQSTGTGARQAWADISPALGRLPTGSRYSLIRFGAAPILEVANESVPVINPETNPTTYTANQAVNTTATNIASALNLAGQQFTELPMKIVLATDGIETIGNATELLENTQRLGLPQPFLLPLAPASSGPDARIVDVKIPTRLRLAEETAITLTLVSNVDVNALLTIQGNEVSLHSQTVELLRDQAKTLRVPLSFHDSGTVQLDSKLSIANDVIPENNQRSIIVNVSGLSRVVYISSETHTSMETSLRAGGWPLTHVQPEFLPQVLSRINPGGVVILDNVSIGSVPESGWLTLIESVRSKGTGLVVLGGDHSFSAGAYTDSTLETALPVISRAGLPLDSAAVLFVVDKSGSMAQKTDELTPFNYAKDAVVGAIGLLGEKDQTGVIAFSITPEIWLPLAQYDDAENSASKAWKNIASGGTDIDPALSLAVESLAKADVDQRLLVLITDGFSKANDYSNTLKLLVTHDIDVIALAIGKDSNMKVLKALTAGKDSRLFQVSDITVLPRMVNESVGANRLAYESGEIQPQIVTLLPFLADDNLTWPTLLGYIVTTARPNANVYIESPRGEPLLAAQHFGLGKVVVLPGGLAELAPDWTAWSNWASFSGGLVEWAGNKLGDRLFHIAIDMNDSPPTLKVDAVTAQGRWLDVSTIAISLRDPLGNIADLKAQRSAPGRFGLVLPLQDSGRYAMTLSSGDITMAHEFIYDAPIENRPLQPSMTDNWLQKNLVQEWLLDDLNSSDVTTTRGFFIFLASLLYFGTFLPIRMLQLRSF